MSTIRRQSIISSAITYFGFALGFIYTYLFTKEGGFTPSQYGLTGTFLAIANIMFSFANLGMLAYIYKFYPYYKDNLPVEKNDMITWSLVISIIGFILVIFGGLVFKNLVIRKFGGNSAELVKYYYWIFPFGFGLTIFSILESYSWQLKKSVLTNYLREIQFRLFSTLLVILFLTGIISDFATFIKLYSLGYILIALALFVYLISRKEIFFTFSVSRVTKKFFKKIVLLATLVWSGGLVFNIANFFAVIVIAAVMPDGLAYAGIYTLAQYIGSLIQAPQRGIIAASIAPLSQAWKDKDYDKINRIYHRSSINQLLFSVGMFVLIWINFRDGVTTFHLKRGFLDAQYIFLFIGLTRVVDMGTGVNSQIIGTSVFWRFDFFTGMLLLALTLPLNYILAKKIGVAGPAIADLITFSIYNGIRYFFLLKKFNMQPFNAKTFFTLIIGFTGYLICYFLFHQHEGFLWIVLRSLVFIVFYLSVIIFFNLSPDLLPVWATIKKRLGVRSER
ncbi:MAG: polysaccharide biosynthesis C-terminal domain-containing protein [Bacteroidetes bacterium]|nr:polysaccharide biosynthesis C-terminal domain-containing protein [Bacteroidota bacterium]